MNLINIRNKLTDDVSLYYKIEIDLRNRLTIYFWQLTRVFKVVNSLTKRLRDEIN